MSLELYKYKAIRVGRTSDIGRRLKGWVMMEPVDDSRNEAETRIQMYLEDKHLSYYIRDLKVKKIPII